MKTIKQADVLSEPADALIYSTNVLLNLTGGVGVQLLERCLEIGGIRTVATSALATGYGDLPLDEFMEVFSTIADEPRFREALNLVLCLPEDSADG